MTNDDLPQRLKDAADWVNHQMDPVPDWDALLLDAAAALRAAKDENARLRQRLLYFENPPSWQSPPESDNDLQENNED